MDPVSAAGIGLGVTGLVFQVFAGCVHGSSLLRHGGSRVDGLTSHRIPAVPRNRRHARGLSTSSGPATNRADAASRMGAENWTCRGFAGSSKSDTTAKPESRH